MFYKFHMDFKFVIMILWGVYVVYSNVIYVEIDRSI